MRTVLRSIAAVILGFLVASAVMMTVEAINGRFLHPGLAKAAEGLKDREAIRALLATAPVTAFIVVIIGWILGSFTGGWVAARVAGGAAIGHGLVVGVLLTLAGIANNLMIPPPLWFWVVSMLVLLPSAYLGARLVPTR